MLQLDQRFTPLEPDALVALATTLQREPDRQVAINTLGAARVIVPNPVQSSHDTLMGRVGENFLQAFLEHPELAAGWYPLTATIYPWKLQPAHIVASAGAAEMILLRRWRAEYFGPLGAIQFEIRPSGQIACQFFAEVDELGRLLECARAAISRPRFVDGLRSVNAHIRPRGDLTATMREDSPCPIEADLVFPANLAGAATAANILTRIFDEPNPEPASSAFDEVRWKIAGNDSRPLVMTISAG